MNSSIAACTQFTHHCKELVDDTILVFQTSLSDIRRRGTSKFGHDIGSLSRRVSEFMQLHYVVSPEARVGDSDRH
ncbi:hypothetical protein [Mycobacterium lepromatosis]|uniref:hypothetical protein n=1 Tax=Mycobacterium lepromatosis TaxID=480418 RepID=UPI00138E326B|nr:hypothetical protein [Mycobacterium lepromatosis]